MGETMNPDPGSEGTVGPVGTMAWLRRTRDEFAARTAALSPVDLAAYVAEAAAAARADASEPAAEPHAPAA